MRNWENLVTNGFRLTHFGSSRWFYADTSEKREKFQELGFQTFPSMDTFPSKYFPHHVLTFVRKERGIKSYKVENWIPTHWLADVLVTDSSETKWSRSETHVDGEAANMGVYRRTKLSQTFWNVDLSCPFHKTCFSGDGHDNRAGAHGVTSSDLSSRDHGHLVIWSMIQHKKGRDLTN